MNPKFTTLPLIALALVLTGCTKDNAAAVKGELSPEQLFESVEFCVLKRAGIDGYSGVVPTPPDGGLSQDSPITASSSFYGEEFRMTARFLGNDGSKDFYEIETHFPTEPNATHEMAYEGSELVVRRFENIEMLLRPSNPKPEPANRERSETE